MRVTWLIPIVAGIGLFVAPEYARLQPETGKVAPIPLQTFGTEIAPAPLVPGNPERTVPPAESTTTTEGNPAPTEPPETIRPLLNQLQTCPAEVASERGTSRHRIVAKQVTVRFTLLPSGELADEEVVASAPTDPDVLTCIKRHLISWPAIAPSFDTTRIEQTIDLL